MPLVSILIPTYNRPGYFKAALDSALNQTYGNIEIIICDDSRNDDTKHLIENKYYDFTQIKYIKNEEQLGAQNHIKCFNISNGEYINFLMDDDILHPLKIEKMINVFLQDQDKNIKLVTSKRILIDEFGFPLPDSFNKSPFKKTCAVEGKFLGSLTFEYGNIIGEPTTVLFKKSDLADFNFNFMGFEFKINTDWINWLKLLAKGNAVYMVEPLSAFRYHGNQVSRMGVSHVIGTIEIGHMFLNANKLGFLEDKDSFKRSLIHTIRTFENTIRDFNEDLKQYDKSALFYAIFEKLKKTLAELDSTKL
jgi:glycosyltransferase involved in cell wall biosynthesis